MINSIDDLIEGEIYFQKSSYDYIFRYRKQTGSIGYGNYLDIGGFQLYIQNTCTNGDNISQVREATHKEREWFLACEKAGKYVALEDVITQEMPLFVY